MARAQKKISKKQFVKQVTDLAVRQLSKLPEQEQEKRLRSFERKVATICRDTDSRPSRTPETPAIRLSAQAREDR